MNSGFFFVFLSTSKLKLQINEQVRNPLVVTATKSTFQQSVGFCHLANISFLVTIHREYNLNEDSNLINVLPKGIAINLSQPLFKDYRIQPI